MLFDCIPVLIHEICLMFIFYISSRLLYFHDRTDIIHDIGQLMFSPFACILYMLFKP
jgi:hypothetical protein